MFKNRNARTAAGAYEEPTGVPARGGRRGFGPLDPDEAWDARVADEAGYYEEQELGVAPRHTGHLGDDTSYGGSSYAMNLAATPGAAPEGFGEEDDHHARGRTLSRDQPRAAGPPGGKNPFDDDADPSNLSLRGVSPRPIDTGAAAAAAAGAEHPKDADSPTERKSVFRENM